MEKSKRTPYSPRRVALGWAGSLFASWFAGFIAIVTVISFALIFGITLPESPIILLALFVVTIIALYEGGHQIGYLQWRLSLRYLVPKYEWGRATAIIILLLPTVSFMFFQLDIVTYRCWSIAPQLCIRDENWFANSLLLGSVIGLTTSVPQWWLFRRVFHRAYLWLVANVASGIISVLQSDAFNNTQIADVLSVLVNATIFATITSITLYFLVRSMESVTKRDMLSAI